MHFGIFTNEMECEKNLQDFSKQVSLYFNTKMPGIRVSKNIIQLVYFNYYKGKSRPKKVIQRVERKIFKTVYDWPQSSTKGLALQVEKDLRLLVSAQNVEKRLRIRCTSSGVLG